MPPQPVQPVELSYAEPEVVATASQAHRRMILLGVGLLILAGELGMVWHNEHGVRQYESLPLWLAFVVQASITLAAIAILTCLLLLFQRRIASIAAAIVLTLGVFFITAQVFRYSPLWTMNFIAGPMPPSVIATRTFVTLLFQAWGSAFLATMIALLIHRDREQFFLATAAFLAGFASASADGYFFLMMGRSTRWLFREAPRMLSSGLMLVTFFLLVALLARSLNAARERRQLRSPKPISST